MKRNRKISLAVMAAMAATTVLTTGVAAENVTTDQLDDILLKLVGMNAAQITAPGSAAQRPHNDTDYSIVAIGKNADGAAYVPGINLAAKNTVAIGLDAKIIGGPAQGDFYEGGIAIGHGTISSGERGVAIGDRARGLKYSSAIGHDAYAYGIYSFAGSSKAGAFSSESIALGTYARVYTERLTKEEYNQLSPEAKKNYIEMEVRGSESNPEDPSHPLALKSYYRDPATYEQEPILYGIAIGSDAETKGQEGTAVGFGSHADGNYSVAYGSRAEAGKTGGTALGAVSSAKGIGSVAVGFYAMTADGVDKATTIGYSAIANKGKSVALGAESVADTAAGAIGYDPQRHAAHVWTESEQNAIAEAQRALTAAQGMQAGAEKDAAIAAAEKQLRIAKQAWESTAGAVSVGSKADGYSRQITNVAAGTEATDAANVAQLRAAQTHYFSVHSDEPTDPAGTNWNNDGATGTDAIAIGKNAKAPSNGTMAIGMGAEVTKATGWNAKRGGMAIGYEAYAIGGSGGGKVGSVAMGIRARAEGDFSIAIGVATHDSDADSTKMFARGDSSIAIGDTTKTYKKESIALGLEATTKEMASIAIGKEAFTMESGAVAIGADSKANIAEGIALGSASVASTASGKQGYLKPTNVESGKEHIWTSTRGALSIGDTTDNKTVTRQITNVAAGTEDTDAVNVAQLSAAQTHYFSANSDDSATPDGTNWNNDGATGTDSMAIGSKAATFANESIAMGKYARVYTERKTQAEYDALTPEEKEKYIKVEDEGANEGQTIFRYYRDPASYLPADKQTSLGIAIGHSATVAAPSAIAIGDKATADLEDGVAIGTNSHAKGPFSVAIGRDAVADSTIKGYEGQPSSGSIAIGYNAYASGNPTGSRRGTIAIGINAHATGKYAIAMGIARHERNRFMATGEKTVSFGFEQKADGNFSIAMGNEAKSNGESSIAMGNKAVSDMIGTIALGNEAKANVADGIALGSDSVASTDKAQVGYLKPETVESGKEHVWTSTRGALSIGDTTGNKTVTRQITGVAAGTNDTDAVNVAQLRAAEIHYFSVNSDDSAAPADTNWNNDGAAGTNAIAIGKDAKAYKGNAVAIGNNAVTSTSQEGGVAIGKGVQADAVRTVAIGYEAKSQGKDGVAIGTWVTITKSKSAQEGRGAVAIGYQATAKGGDFHGGSIAIGRKVKAMGERSIAIGASYGSQATPERTLASGNYSIALGPDARAYQENDIAIGGSAIANVTNGIALGSASVASTASGVAGYLKPETVESGKEHIWTSTRGALSIGDTTGNTMITRQITNVAAGSVDTDAVNVAQLRAAQTHYFSVKSDDSAAPAETNWNNDGARSEGSIAIGSKAAALTKDSVVIGKYAKAYTERISETEYDALTPEEKAKYIKMEYSVLEQSGPIYYYYRDPASYGPDEKQADESVAIGYGASAGADGSVAIGNESAALGSASVAIGQASIAGDTAIVIGVASSATGKNGLSMGQNMSASGDYSIAIGTVSSAYYTGSAVIGIGSVAQNFNTMVLGNYSTATVRDSVALGSYSDADRELGGRGYDPFLDAVREDRPEVAAARQAMEDAHLYWRVYDTTEAHDEYREKERAYYDLVDNAWEGTLGALSIGGGMNTSKEATRQIINVAAGTEDTDAVNVAQLKALRNYVQGEKTRYFSVNSDDSAAPSETNWNNDGARGTDSIAIGSKAATFANESIAMGKYARVYKEWKTQAEYDALTPEEKAKYIKVEEPGQSAGNPVFKYYRDPASYGSNEEAPRQGMAIGFSAKAMDSWAMAVGMDAEASATLSMAVGPGAQAVKYGSIAMGQAAEAGGYQSIALGMYAFARQDAVALGANSNSDGYGSTALGNQSDVSSGYGVALGYGSDATREAGTRGYDPATGTIKADSPEVEAARTAMLEAYTNWQDDPQNEDLAELYYNKHKAYIQLADTTWEGAFGALSLGDDRYISNGMGGMVHATRQITDVAAGSEDTDAVNLAQLKAAQTHYFSVNSNDLSAPADTNWNNDGAKGANAIAIGRKALSSGEDSLAIGHGSRAIASRSMAIGYYNNASNDESIAIGMQNNMEKKSDGTFRPLGTGVQSVTVGVLNHAAGPHTVVIGRNNESGPAADESVVIGARNKSEDKHSAVVGFGNIAKKRDSVAMGEANDARSAFSVAVGAENIVHDESNYGVALGRSNKVKATEAIAVGFSSVASGKGALVVGHSSNASAVNSIAIGRSAKATIEGGIALGSNAVTEAAAGVTGYLVPTTVTEGQEHIWTSTRGALSLGDTAGETKITRQITGLAAGTNDTDAVNVAQLQAVNAKADTAVQSFTVGADAAATADGIVVDSTHKRFDVVGAENSGITTQVEGETRTLTVGINPSVLAQNITSNVVTNINNGGTAITNIQGSFKVNDNAFEFGQGHENAELKVIGATEREDGVKVKTTKTNDVHELTLDLTTKTKETLAQVATNKTDITNLTTRVATNETSITQLGDRVTTNEGNITSNTTKITANETSITQLGDRVTTNETSITQLGDRVTTNEGNITSNTTKITANETSITQLGGRVTTNETSITQLGNRVTTNEGNITSNTTKITANETSITQLGGRVATNEGNITSNTANIGLLQAGFKLKANNVTSNVALGTAQVPTIEFVAQDDTANPALTVELSDNKVTYILDQSKLIGGGGTATPVKLTIKGGASDTAGHQMTLTDTAQDIVFDKDGEILTVERTDNKIIYGLDKAALVTNVAGDIITHINGGDTAITNIAGNFQVNGEAFHFGKDHESANLEVAGTSGITVTPTTQGETRTLTVGINPSVLAQNITSNVVTNINNGGTAVTNIQGSFKVNDNAFEFGQGHENAELKVIGATEREDGVKVKTTKTNDVHELKLDLTTKTKETLAQVATNKTDITNLSTRVTTNETSITQLGDRVTTNETSITQLGGRVTTNETSITQLGGRVTTNEGNITSNTAKITANETSITQLGGRVTTNEGNITSNTANIGLLQAGFKLKANDVMSNVALGTAQVPTIEFVAQDDTANPALTVKLSDNKVTYILDQSKLIGGGGTAAPVNLTIKGGASDTAGHQMTLTDTAQDIVFDKDGNILTVERTDNKIIYGLDKAALVTNVAGDIITHINSGDTAITNIAGNFQVNGEAFHFGKGHESANLEVAGTSGITVTPSTQGDTRTLTVGINQSVLAQNITSNVVTNINNGGTAITNIQGSFKVNANAFEFGQGHENAELKVIGATESEDGVKVKTTKTNDVHELKLDLTTKTKETLAQVATNKTDITNLTTRVATNETSITQLGDRVTTNETSITQLGDRVTTNETSITQLGDRVTTNEGNITSNTAKITANETSITQLGDRVTTNETSITQLGDRVTANEGNITSNTAKIGLLQAGFKLKANDVTSNVSLGTAQVPTIEFVAQDDTANPALTVELSDNKVTYILDQSKLIGGGGTAASVKLTIKGGASDTAGHQMTLTDTAQDIVFDKDGEILTVERTDNKIIYGLDKAALVTNVAGDIITHINSGDTAITNIAGSFKVNDNLFEFGKGHESANLVVAGTSGITVTPTTQGETRTLTVGINPSVLAQNITSNVVTNINNGGTAITNIQGSFKVNDNAFEFGQGHENAELKVIGATEREDGVKVKTTKTNDVHELTLDLTTKTKETLAQVATNETSITQLGDRVTTNETSITQLGNRVTTNEGNITSNTTKITANETSITQLGDRVTANEGNITNNTAKIANKADKDAGNLNTGDVTAWKDKLGITDLESEQFHYVSIDDGGTQQANWDNDGATGANAIAIGAAAAASGEGATALGYGANGAGNLATAVGMEAAATGDDGVALGYRAAANADDGTAVGANAQVNVVGGVALGSESVAARNEGTAGYLMPDNASGAAWTSTRAAVAVGDTATGITRQITGVAAGSEETDAVNVAQLAIVQGELAEVATTAGNAMRSFTVGNGDATGNAITVDKDNTRFDVVGAADSGVITSIAGDAVVVGLNHARVAAGINAGATAVTNISAFFRLKDGAGADRTIELRQGAVPAIEWLGEDGMIDVAVTGSGSDAIVTIKTNQDLGTNLDIRNNASIVSLNEQIGSLGAWKLQANSGHERAISKDDVVNFTDGSMTEVTVAGNDIQIDLNAATKAKIGEIDDLASGVDSLGERMDTAEGNIGELQGKVTAAEGRLDTVEGKVTTLEGDMTTMKGDVTTIKGDVTAIQGDVRVIQSEMTTMQGNIDQLGNDIDDLGQQILDNKVSVKAGKNVAVTANDKATEYTVALADDIDVTSVTAKEVAAETVTADTFKVGDKTYIDAEGIHANDQRIAGVAAGEAATDAVNMGQLKQVADGVSQVGQGLSELQKESREADALGAALSALKPIQYDPIDRSQIMAGVGTYRGEQAVALGVSHYTNENTLLHAGVSYGGSSHLMANAGVTWRFGSDAERRAAIPERYQAGPISSVYVMQDEMSAVLEENASMKERLATQDEKIAAQDEKIVAQDQELREQRERIERLEEALRKLM